MLKESFKLQEENGAAWISWLLDAIHKIKYQKQRPNVERVAACIRQHHPQYSNETVYQVFKNKCLDLKTSFHCDLRKI